jgi:hypothetical protein
MKGYLKISISAVLLALLLWIMLGVTAILRTGDIYADNSLTIASLSGILKGTAGLVQVATPGIDYVTSADSVSKCHLADSAKHGGLEYKVYVALLTQSGTNAPVAIELQNTLGVISWNYAGVGRYTANAASLFPLGKTTLQIQGDRRNDGGINVDSLCSVNQIDNSTIYVMSFTVDFTAPNENYTNDFLRNDFVEIRVYP